MLCVVALVAGRVKHVRGHNHDNARASVSAELVATAGSISYLSPDYTSIAPKSANTTALKVASLVNAVNGKTYTPSVANTETGLANPGPGAANTTPPASLTAAMDPVNWVPSNPKPASGYPIVGYGALELSTCYNTTTAGAAINAFLLAEYQTASYKTIITNNGFAPLSNTAAAPFVTSIVGTFLSNKNGYNLNIDNKTACASYSGR